MFGMLKNCPFLILIGIVFLSLILSCSVVETRIAGEEATITQTSTFSDGVMIVESSGSTIAASSIPELSHYSDVVVIGKFIEKEKIIHTTRNTKDLSQPHPRFFGVSQVYLVEVLQYLKGNGPDRIKVTQHLGALLVDPYDSGKEATPSPSDIDNLIQENAHKYYEPVNMGAEYLLFLRVFDSREYEMDGYLSTQIYSGALQPWRFIINEDEQILSETFLDGLKKMFPPMPLDVAIEHVNMPYTPADADPANPYPPPSSTEPSPYPSP